MKKILIVLSVAGALAACKQKAEQQPEQKTTQPKEAAAPEGKEIMAQSEPDTLKGSPAAIATGAVGDAHFTITYHSPAVRGRIIWGGLVPYDKVWVTGAHMATTVESDKPITVGSVIVAPGKFALFTIPAKDTWTIILNKNWSQHLADDYNEKDDIVRVQVKPTEEATHQERLRYVIGEESATAGKIDIYWEKLKVTLPFEIAH